jgi:hypothetical protein
MSAPQYITKWLAQTGGIPAIQGITPPASTAAYFEGAWGQPEIINPFTSSSNDIAPGVPFTEAYDGYLLGSKTLGQEVTYLEGLFQHGAAYLVRNDCWTGQPWASSLPSSPEPHVGEKRADGASCQLRATHPDGHRRGP